MKLSRPQIPHLLLQTSQCKIRHLPFIQDVQFLPHHLKQDPVLLLTDIQIQARALRE